MLNCLKCLVNKLEEETRSEVRENKNYLVRTISCKNKHVLEIVEDEAGFLVYSQWLESGKFLAP